MSNTSITQRALADSLKKLMTDTPINHIHVQMITDDCGLTRHTFYNHFRDVYELLGWIYDQEVIEGLDQYCTLAQWPEGILLVLQYTERNRVICLNTFHSLGRDHLEGFLYRVFFQLLENVVKKISQTMILPKGIKQECCEFYANALVGVFTAWLKTNLEKSSRQMANQIDRVMSGSIMHTLKKFEVK